MRLLSHAYSKYLRLIGGPNQSHKVNLKEPLPSKGKISTKATRLFSVNTFPVENGKRVEKERLLRWCSLLASQLLLTGRWKKEGGQWKPEPLNQVLSLCGLTDIICHLLSTSSADYFWPKTAAAPGLLPPASLPRRRRRRPASPPAIRIKSSDTESRRRDGRTAPRRLKRQPHPPAPEHRAQSGHFLCQRPLSSCSQTPGLLLSAIFLARARPTWSDEVPVC